MFSCDSLIPRSLTGMIAANSDPTAEVGVDFFPRAPRFIVSTAPFPLLSCYLAAQWQEVPLNSSLPFLLS